MRCPIENHIVWHRPSVKKNFLFLPPLLFLLLLIIICTASSILGQKNIVRDIEWEPREFPHPNFLAHFPETLSSHAWEAKFSRGWSQSINQLVFNCRKIIMITSNCNSTWSIISALAWAINNKKIIKNSRQLTNVIKNVS